MPASTRHFGFTGERGDGATGLDYFNARYYDPVAGQFTSADTVLPGNGYDAFGLSRYAYVEGNPTTRTDPSGRCPWCIGALVGGVIGGAVSYGTQVAGNLQRGQSLGSALTHVDVGEIGKATLVGMVIGGTGGLATAGLGALGLGGVAAGVGGRVVLGGVEAGGAQIGDNLLHGRSWNDGVGGAMLIGSATGGLSPLGGAALRQVTKRFGSRVIEDGEVALRGGVEPGVRNRPGRVVRPEEGLEWALSSPEQRAALVVNTYGINLKASGRRVTLHYDENLRGRSGRVFEDDPTVINFGPEALQNEEELGRTIAHELRHSRGYLGSGLNTEQAAQASEDALGGYIRGAL